MIKIFDSHCHPQHERYENDRDVVIRRALDSGVGMIAIGNDLESSRQAVALAGSYGNVWAAIGLHPNDDLREVFDVQVFRELTMDPKVVAVGETGLDYHHSPDKNELHIQYERFQQHIALAREFQKPLVIHSRDSYEDTLAVLSVLPEGERRGVIHSFTGTYEQAQKFIELGFSVGLNGIITFSDSYGDLVRKLPLENILCETDAPFLAPVPYRGKRNEPAYVTYVAEQVARLRDMSVEKVMEQTTQNAKKLFGIA